MEWKGKSRVLAMGGCVLAASLALSASNPGPSRIYIFDNLTTLDQSMTTPRDPERAPVPCNDNTLGVQVKCSARGSWKTLTNGENVPLACAHNDGSVLVRDKGDHDTQFSVTWQCSMDDPDAPEGVTASFQNVEVRGQLSICTDSNVITASPSCGYFVRHRPYNPSSSD